LESCAVKVPMLSAPFDGDVDPTHLVACDVPQAQAAMAVQHAAA
jgi:hypothetical protein